MSTTIVLKHGTGAPTSEDLEVGEIGIDIASKNLYTKDGGGDIIQLGGNGGTGGTVDWDDVLNKPDSFPPESHNHDMAQVSGLGDELNRIDGELNNLQGLIDATMDQLAFGGTWDAATGKISDGVKAGINDGDDLPDPAAFPSTFLICVVAGDNPTAGMTTGDWLVSDGVTWHSVMYETAGGVAWENILGKPTEFPPEAHTHTTAEITGLDAALANKADLAHTHEIANINGLQAALDAKLDENGFIYGGVY